MQIGKITISDLRILLNLVPLLEIEVAEGREILAEKRDKIFADDCIKGYWCQFYEMPFPEHLGRVLGAMGLGEVLHEIAAAPSQFQAIDQKLKEFDHELESEEVSVEEAEQLRPNLAVIFGFSLSLYNSLRCLLAFGCYLNDLIANVKQGGEQADEALFKAIKIDPTVMGCHSVLTRISQATMEDDANFFKNLKLSLRGKLAKQEQANYKAMRLVLQALKESGAGRLSDEQLYDLFVKELDLYSGSGKDPWKALRNFADMYMKAAATI